LFRGVALPQQPLPASHEDQLYYRPMPSLYQGFHVFVAPKNLQNISAAKTKLTENVEICASV
jgi:hypothetical protein